MTKRHKSVVISLLLVLGFYSITFLENENRVLGISILSLSSIPFFFWALRDAIKRNATLLCLVLPPLFTFGVGLFWFLLPSTFYAKLPVIILYGVGVYVMALTANIFAVSVQKKIALARAAKGVSFVLTLFVSFLLYDAVLSLRVNILTSSALLFAASFPLFLQGLWVSKITSNLEREVLVYSLVLSYVVAAGGLMLYFWPVSVVVGSLFLTVGVYVLLGLGEAKLEGRLFKQTINEYLVIGVLVFLVMFFSTSWRG